MFSAPVEGKTSSILWVGRESDRAAAIEMFQYLSALGKQFAGARVAEFQSKPALIEMLRLTANDKQRRTKLKRTIREVFAKWSNDFIFGFASALHDRLTENRSRLEAAPSDTRLIVRNEGAIQKYVDDEFIRTPGKARSVKTKFDGALFRKLADRPECVSIKARAGLGEGS